jgi:hypothetical protein
MVYLPVHPFSQIYFTILLDNFVPMMYIFDSNTVPHYDYIDLFDQSLTFTSIHVPLSYI